MSTLHRTATRVYWTLDSPVGELLLAGDGEHLRRLHFVSGDRPVGDGAGERSEAPFAEMCEQLDQYFAGERREFELPLEPAGGSAFERRVWDALREIPYGETRSYGEVAAEIGAPGRARAVGAANARNPIAIAIPCHRVIGADGSLTGYAGGLERKRLLLDLESPARPLEAQPLVSSSSAKTKLS